MARFPGECVAQEVGDNVSQRMDAPPSSPEWHYQFTLLHYLFERQGFTTATSIEELKDETERVVVVSLGQQSPRLWQREGRELLGRAAFLIATDYAFEVPGFFSVSPGPVVTNASEMSYLGHTDCLQLALDLNARSRYRGINAVVLNRAGWIKTEGAAREGWELLGRYPLTVSPQGARGKPWLARWTLPGSRDAAPMIVVSDQSVLSNGMLWHGENLLFALRLIEDLGEAGRDRVVFVVNGRMMGKNPQLSPPPTDDLQPQQLPDLPEQLPEDLPLSPSTTEMLEIANSVIAKVEEADLINELLVDQPRRILPPYFRRLLIVGLTGLLIAAGVYLFSLQDQRKTGTSQIALEGGGLVNLAPRRAVFQEPVSPEERGLVAQAMIRDAFIHWTGSEEREHWKQWSEQFEGPPGGAGHSPARHLLHWFEMDPIPPTSKEKLVSIGRDLLTLKSIVASRSAAS